MSAKVMPAGGEVAPAPRQGKAKSRGNVVPGMSSRRLNILSPEQLVFSPSGTKRRAPKIATAVVPTVAPLDAPLDASSFEQTRKAMMEAARTLKEQLDGDAVADLVLCVCTEQHRPENVMKAASEFFGKVPFAANTTHGGLIFEVDGARNRWQRERTTRVGALGDP